jgi:hypothetical protein
VIVNIQRHRVIAKSSSPPPPCPICRELLDRFVSAAEREREAGTSLTNSRNDAERVAASRAVMAARRDTTAARQDLVEHYTAANTAEDQVLSR